jgi:hypothetical protein
MSCCGNKRSQLLETTATRMRVDPKGRSVHVPQQPPQLAVWFEYVGQTGMTVIGGATGKAYRFDRPGSRVMVDLRDEPSLFAVPNLRRS